MKGIILESLPVGNEEKGNLIHFSYDCKDCSKEKSENPVVT